MKKVLFPKSVKVKCIKGNKRSFPVQGKIYEAVGMDARGQLYFADTFPEHKNMNVFEQVPDTPPAAASKA